VQNQKKNKHRQTETQKPWGNTSEGIEISIRQFKELNFPSIYSMAKNLPADSIQWQRNLLLDFDFRTMLTKKIKNKIKKK
jgi:hypothetical protein